MLMSASETRGHQTCQAVAAGYSYYLTNDTFLVPGETRASLREEKRAPGPAAVDAPRGLRLLCPSRVRPLWLVRSPVARCELAAKTGASVGRAAAYPSCMHKILFT